MTGAFMIEASTAEVQEIVKAVTGKELAGRDIEVGMKMPAVDYSMTIQDAKTLSDSYGYKQMMSACRSFTKQVEKLDEKIQSSNKL